MQYTPVTQYVANPPVVPPFQTLPCPDPPSTPSGVVSPWRIRVVADKDRHVECGSCWMNLPQLKVTEKDRSCLEMQMSGGGEETCACCDSMVLKIGNESLKVAVVEKQVQVNGSFFKGSADTVTRNSADGSILLEGHVKLKYEKAGQKAEVNAGASRWASPTAGWKSSPWSSRRSSRSGSASSS